MESDHDFADADETPDFGPDFAHPLWMPLAAYYAAKKIPDVIDVSTAADVLATNVARFLASEYEAEDPCGAPSGYHDDGDPMLCTLRDGHSGDHSYGSDFSWAPGTLATDSEDTRNG